MKQEIINLIEENIVIRDKISDAFKNKNAKLDGYSRLHLSIVVRLYMSGRAKLKDIANREGMANSNLCSCFRSLEKNGMVVRTVDENDRRNTWYSVTKSGEDLAKRALEIFRGKIAKVFASLSKEDEAKLIQSIKTTNEILKKVEIIND